jgi:RNA polymerase sigma-70 factor (ECF subfamily)
MFVDTSTGQLDQFTKSLIRRKAHQLIGLTGLKKHDRQDLEQDMYLRVLRAAPSFNAETGHWNVFVTAVIDRYAANILRNRSNARRDDRFVESLNATCIVNGQTTDLSQTIGDRNLAARLGRDVHDETRDADRRMDVATAMQLLSPELQNLAQRLASSCIAEVARELGVPRTSLYRARGELRAHFEKCGIENYF